MDEGARRRPGSRIRLGELAGRWRESWQAYAKGVPKDFFFAYITLFLLLKKGSSITEATGPCGGPPLQPKCPGVTAQSP